MGLLSLSWYNRRWGITLFTDQSACTPVDGCLTSFNFLDLSPPVLLLVFQNTSGLLALTKVLRPLLHGLGLTSASTISVFSFLSVLDIRERFKKTMLTCKKCLYFSISSLHELSGLSYVPIHLFCFVCNLLWKSQGTWWFNSEGYNAINRESRFITIRIFIHIRPEHATYRAMTKSQ